MVLSGLNAKSSNHSIHADQEDGKDHSLAITLFITYGINHSNKYSADCKSNSYYKLLVSAKNLW